MTIDSSSLVEIVTSVLGGGASGFLVKTLIDRWMKKRDKLEEKQEVAFEKEQELQKELEKQVIGLTGRIDALVERLSARSADAAQLASRVEGIGQHYGGRVRDVEQRIATLEGKLELLIDRELGKKE